MTERCPCNGEGWYFDEARNRRVVCSCPAGWSKKEYLSKSREERKRERKGRKRGRKARRDEVPF